MTDATLYSDQGRLGGLSVLPTSEPGMVIVTVDTANLQAMEAVWHLIRFTRHRPYIEVKDDDGNVTFEGQFFMSLNPIDDFARLVRLVFVDERREPGEYGNKCRLSRRGYDND